MGTCSDVKKKKLPIFTVAELEGISQHDCGNPECKNCGKGGTLQMRPKCHPESGLDAAYETGSCRVTLSCHECKQVVSIVAVGLVAV